MKKLLLTVALALLGLLGFALAPAHASRDINNGCCTERDGRLVCTITGETLNQCCCE